MPTEVTCPDCGKTIAPRGAIDETLRCRCAEKPTFNKKSDTVDDEIESFADGSAASREKTCYVCGKSLAGRVRLKDHLGRYWCKQCASKDKKRQRQEEKGRCPDCSRVFPPEKLVYFQTTRVCPTCFREREKELEKKIKKAAAEKIHEKAEWSSIKWMAIAAGVLLLLGTIGYLMHH